MVKCKYITPKHRAYAAIARVNKLLLPRALFMAAKYRARRPLPTFTVAAWNGRKMLEDDLAFHPPWTRRYSKFPAAPLVSPDRWRALYSFSLERPPIPDIDPERVAHAQPQFEGLPPAHIRDTWVLMNYRQMGLYARIFVDPPKTRLPSTFNVVVKDLGLASSPTHVFGVYDYVPPGYTGDPVRRQARHGLRIRRAVRLYPTHAAIWAAHCAHLPAIAPAPRDPDVRLLSPTKTPGVGARARSTIHLPVVPLPVPYPTLFSALVTFVGTNSKGLFIWSILPCRCALPEATTEGDAYYSKVVDDLAHFYGMRQLCCVARGVYGTYQNMCALGMVDDRIWEALDLAWKILLKAMETVDERGRQETQS